MGNADASTKPDQKQRTVEPQDPKTDCYHGVELAPITLESLVTWDISVLARREQDRLNPSCGSSLPTPVD